MENIEALENQRPAHVPGYRVEILDNEIILFSPSSRMILYSNQTGALIWQLCDGQRTTGDIIQTLSAAYPEAVPKIREDVHETLLTFAQHGAIVWHQ